MTGLAYRGPAGSYTDTGGGGGGPCSALAASMQPQQGRDTAGWDEFGFRLESVEDGEEEEGEESVMVECPQRRLQVTNSLVLITDHTLVTPP